jgi:hypothetical protein
MTYLLLEEYIQHTTQTLKRIFNSTPSLDLPDRRTANSSAIIHSSGVHIPLTCISRGGTEEGIWKRLVGHELRTKHQEHVPVCENSARGYLKDLDVNATQEETGAVHLTASQKTFLNHLAEHIDDELPKGCTAKQLLYVLLGGPGTGKTTTIKEFISMATASGVGVLSSAFTGIAASNIPGAGTVNGIWGIPVAEKYKEENEWLDGIQTGAANALRASLHGVKYIVIDEISMTNSMLLAKVHQRLRQVGNSKKDFGGFHMILCGDFQQLEPVGGRALYGEVLKRYAISGVIPLKPDKPRAIGAHLFSKFRIFDLTEQTRARGDKVQIETLRRMRDLTNKMPISIDLLHSLIKHNTLSKDDFATPPPADDPEDTWSNAIMCVASNQERINLNAILAKRFAKERGVPVVVFSREVLDHDKKSGGRLNLMIQSDEGLRNRFYALESEACGLFVSGAPCYISENVDPVNGLANGTPCFMHSLSFGESVSDIQLHAIEDQISLTPPGEVCFINNTPDYINVIIPTLKDAKWPVGATLVAGHVVVPIGLKTRSSVIKRTAGFRSALKVKMHRIELRFAVTFHKVQGQTVKKIILVLNQRHGNRFPQLSFGAILVALSRATSRAGIRIMPVNNINSLNYLTRKTHSKDLRIWRAGIQSSGLWSAEKSSAFCENIKTAAETKKNRKPSASGKRCRTAPPTSCDDSLSRLFVRTTSAISRPTKEGESKTELPFSKKIVYSRPATYGSKNYCVDLSGPPLGLNDYNIAPLPTKGTAASPRPNDGKAELSLLPTKTSTEGDSYSQKTSVTVGKESITASPDDRESHTDQPRRTLSIPQHYQPRGLRPLRQQQLWDNGRYACFLNVCLAVGSLVRHLAGERMPESSLLTPVARHVFFTLAQPWRQRSRISFTGHNLARQLFRQTLAFKFNRGDGQIGHFGCAIDVWKNLVQKQHDEGNNPPTQLLSLGSPTQDEIRATGDFCMLPLTRTDNCTTCLKQKEKKVYNSLGMNDTMILRKTEHRGMKLQDAVQRVLQFKIEVPRSCTGIVCTDTGAPVICNGIVEKTFSATPSPFFPVKVQSLHLEGGEPGCSPIFQESIRLVFPHNGEVIYRLVAIVQRNREYTHFTVLLNDGVGWQAYDDLKNGSRTKPIKAPMHLTDRDDILFFHRV